MKKKVRTLHIDGKEVKWRFSRDGEYSYLNIWDGKYHIVNVMDFLRYFSTPEVTTIPEHFADSDSVFITPGNVKKYYLDKIKGL